MSMLTLSQACAESVMYTKNVEEAGACRFCGYKDGLLYCEDISPIVSEESKAGCYILCTRCGARGPIDSVRGRAPSEAWAIRLWNEGVEV